MLRITCQGSPFEIGKQHGSAAANQVKGCIEFYEGFFQKQSHKTWAEVRIIAQGFSPYLESSWPDYVEEMKGVAEGAGVDFESILALNVRTEIGYGLQSDGCTTFSWKTDHESFLAQNWDWNEAQSKNLINLHITQSGKPSITMVTEAGILGKIGFNSAGVGVTLNALRAAGARVDKLPTHLALRTVLNSTSQQAARATLLETGVAAACHITIADLISGGIGLECSSEDIVELEMEDGICAHSNHMLRLHKVPDKFLVADSPFRVARAQELLRSLPGPTMDGLRSVLKDEKNYPGAICRAAPTATDISTLFSIVMDLKEKLAVVKLGRPTESGPEFELRL